MSTPFSTRILCALLCVVAAACSTDSGDGEMPPARGEGAPERAELPSLQYAETESDRTASSTGQATGTTHALDRAQVGPSVSGTIAQVEVDEGDEVDEGQVLFRLRRGDVVLRLQQARAALETAEVEESAARVELERVQRLLEKDAIDRARFDRVQAKYDAARAGVGQAKAAVNIARKAVRDTAVRAPFDGVVTAVLQSEGEMISTMPPTPVVVVEDHSQLELRFRLPERALSSIEVGETITADFTAVDLERRARIDRISPNVDPRTRTVEVTAVIDNADRSLKPGMLAHIDLTRERRAQTAPPADAGQASP